VAQIAGSGAVQARPALPLPDKPSIAVLPFRNFSGDPRQDYFADAFTDEVITELSRSRFLFVIASNSTFTYKGKAVKVQDVASELGVQYVLEGSIQRSGDRLRITAQLVDAIADHHVWAETYVRDAKDIFNVQDEAAQKIVATIGPGASTELARAVRERAKRKNPADLKAYEYFLLGLELDERFTKESVAEGRKLIAKAIELDPNFARAYAEMAWVHYYDWLWGWSDDPDLSARKALEVAKMAVSVDDADEKAHWTLGAMYYKIERDFDRAVTEYQRALTINPNYADLMHSWGYLLAYLGRPEEGILEMQKARRLNPHYPDWYNTNLGAALYIAGRYQDAIATLKLIREQNPDSQTFLAASYAQLGRHAEALAMAAEIGKAYPDFSSRAWAEKLPFKSEVDRDHFVEGLKKAGLPN
jgi:adenylate cyclase